jgi:serine O-acetyltransferase
VESDTDKRRPLGRRSDFRADLARYSRSERLSEPSLWAIAIYRLGRWIDSAPARRPLLVLYLPAHLVVSLLTGISIPKSTRIGAGLRIHHFGGIVVHNRSVLGRNVTIGHGVTLGVRENAEQAPVIGDNVVLSAYAQILGGVHVNEGAKVGAMSVVLHDVPPGAAVAGVPARVVGVRKDRPE